MNTANNATYGTMPPGLFGRGRPSFELGTVVLSTLALIVLCMIFAPSSISSGALAGSLPFAAVAVIVSLGQMLVVQQGGFDLSVPGAISLSVVISTHYPAGNDAELLPAVLLALAFALGAGLFNGILIGVVRLNAIVATIGTNALLYGGVIAISGGVPRTTTPLLSRIAGGEFLGLGYTVWYALVILLIVAVVLKKTVAGRRFEGIGANPAMARTVGLRVRSYELSAYVSAQLLYCLAGILLAGLTSQPTAFLGNSYLLPSVAIVVLGGTSLMGGRGFPVPTALAAFFLTQLGQFSITIGVPFSAQTIIQALALGLGIAVYSFRRS
ncbi:Ribose transport system permease protein RbsC [Aquimixticola soesokkakensis]|uniref:Autoinducer 2 import system permease protein LsrC n=1 Tax=Aquimixticola soesokkakensis TaxID=1519096 RepID=A0A1Y5T1J8_9RHOB|nr:ABC transporter permease [Aquimixticola soesokkakensis]SLN53877.1 Ribose transport system permease protein RbsC [Aquimixticola soesokkakensis]